MIICKECDREFRRITALHLWTKHAMTMKEYRKKYPGTEIVDAGDDTVGNMRDKFASYPK